ncbi:hypothetical protein E2542_SST05194 [Spatholobus suberectus]|nr:hypothetical protein E2542_SST05194 [Spatholobus suberectus]
MDHTMYMASEPNSPKPCSSFSPASETQGSSKKRKNLLNRLAKGRSQVQQLEMGSHANDVDVNGGIC